MKNIVLVGFMGTGKSAIGRRLAKELKLKYVNTDEIIEEQERRPISEIFAKEGEPYFREIEKKVVREVSSMDGVVIATGGGVVLDSGNMENLAKCGVIICLNASPEVILERTKRYTLLNIPDPLARIKELLKERDPYYKKADFQVDTTDKRLEAVVKEIEGLV